MSYQLGAASDSWLSPDGQELVIQGPEYNGQAAHMATTVLNCVKGGRKANGYFELSGKPVRMPRARRVRRAGG
jgi:hypothetical protein